MIIRQEDHHLSFIYFEGVILECKYGAGKLEIWDKGFYTDNLKEESGAIEKNIENGIKKEIINHFFE